MNYLPFLNLDAMPSATIQAIDSAVIIGLTPAAHSMVRGKNQKELPTSRPRKVFSLLAASLLLFGTAEVAWLLLPEAVGKALASAMNRLAHSQHSPSPSATESSTELPILQLPIWCSEKSAMSPLMTPVAP